MTRSIWPRALSRANSQTPSPEPARPPTSRIRPILTSTLPRSKWAMTPDTEAPTTWLAPEATATGAGMPRKSSIGVSRKPPPTPNTPDRMPTPAPTPSSTRTLALSSAIGR